LFCRECGKQVDESWATCPHCVAKIYHPDKTTQIQPSFSPPNIIQKPIQSEQAGFNNPFHAHGIIDDGKPKWAPGWGKLAWIIGFLLLVLARVAVRTQN
jgi:hypothetical protein